MKPKTRQAEYDWLDLTVDRKSLQIKELTAADQRADDHVPVRQLQGNPGLR